MHQSRTRAWTDRQTDLEELAGDELLELLRQGLAHLVGLLAVHDTGQRGGLLVVDLDVEPHQVVLAVAAFGGWGVDGWVSGSVDGWTHHIEAHTCVRAHVCVHNQHIYTSCAPDDGVLHGGVALGAALELVEEVSDHL